MNLLDVEFGRWILAAWFLLAGGAIGSFLNVVVYRLPAGMSVVWPPSHCPRCKRAIRSYDNIPVLAWFWLRGRCRDCGGPISIRYPLVEALTAGIFLLLLVVEVFHSGRNLPVPGPLPPAQAWGLCLFHLGLLCTLMAAALIRWDGHQPPQRLFVPMLLAGFAAASVWPWLHPLAADAELAGSRWRGAVDSLVGLAAGNGVGRIAAWLGKRTAVMHKPGSQVLGEAMAIGVVLGWQGMVVVVPAALLLEELSRIAAVRFLAARRFVAAVWIVPLTLLWILNWARLAAWMGM